MRQRRLLGPFGPASRNTSLGEIVMHRRNFLRSSVAGGSFATLFSLTTQARSEAVAAFQAALGQQSNSEYLTVFPGSASFESLTKGLNARWTAPNAKVVYLPLRTSGIPAAILSAQRDGHAGSLRVRGGGHCYEDFVFNPETTAILDMSLLNDVGFDAEKGVFYAEAGANIYDLQSRLIRMGRTLPGGSCPTVGLGGHVSGGGFGVLSRCYGLTVDWLTGVALTHMKSGSPEPIAVSKDSTGTEGDLFWAHTGGGGGNFGVITRYDFADLPRAPTSAVVSIYGWDWSTIVAKGGSSYFSGIIGLFEALCEELPLSSFAILKLAHQDGGQVQIIVQDVQFNSEAAQAGSAAIMSRQMAKCGLGATSEELRALPGHLALPQPAARTQMSWWQAITFFSGSSGKPFCFKHKSAFLNTGFTPKDSETIYRHLTRRMGVPLTASLLQVDSYGGAINNACRTDTAAWHRMSKLELQYQTYWLPERQGLPPGLIEATHLAWIRDFYAEMYAHLGGTPDPARDTAEQWDGCYINYPDSDLAGSDARKALDLYYGGNLPRLIRTKAAWDPQNVFQHRLSIPTS